VRFARADLRGHIVSHENDLGAERCCSVIGDYECIFARFLTAFDFRLFQQYRREANIRRSGEVRKVPKPGISPEPLDPRAVRFSEPRRDTLGRLAAP